MPFPSAAIQRATAGFREIPAASRENSGTAAGRVGVAVLLALAGAASPWPGARVGVSTVSILSTP